ncbi:MAG: hypothetical protein LW834_00580 [Cyanobium sp. 49614_E6]|nr:hypothetical protein [Cyanobium sp. 49614_E6]
MEEMPRQLPQVHPGLGIRSGQGGNFISVRQKPDQDGGWGTLRNPKRFELPLLQAHRLRSNLGYEAVPASEFWQFTTPARIRLQVDRISSDRYASSVGVALLDAGNQRVAPLVQSASGRGEPVEIAAGTYKMVASLGLAENLKDLIFELTATPVGAALLSVAGLSSSGHGQLATATAATRQRLLHGAATTAVSATSQLLGGGRHHLQGLAAATLSSSATLLRQSGHSSGQVTINISGRGQLHSTHPAPLAGQATLSNTGAATLSAVRWLDEPQSNWRARSTSTGVVELNRSYVRFDRDPISQQALLQQLALLLS